MVDRRARSAQIVACIALASFGFAGLAQAQKTSAARANAGYSRALAQTPITAGTNGQAVAAAGATQADQNQSSVPQDDPDGSLGIASGVGGSGSGTVLGDTLDVVTRSPEPGAQSNQTGDNGDDGNQAQSSDPRH